MATIGVGMSGLGVILLLTVGGGFVGSGDVVPLPADPVVAQIAPAECLFYSSWTGKTRATPGAASSTEQLFTDSKFVDYLRHIDELLQQGASQGIASQGVSKEHMEGAFRLLKHLHTHAGACYLSEVVAKQNQSPEIFGGLVIRVDDDDVGPVVETLESLLQLVPERLRSSTKSGDTLFSRINPGEGAPPVTWGIQGNYLVVGIGEGEAQRIIARLDRSAPAWLSKAQQTVVTPRPASFFHLDLKRLFDTIGELLDPRDAEMFAGVLEAFGLDALESVAYGGGLDEQGTVSHGLLKLSGELSGMLTLLDCEPLVAKDFQLISSSSPVALLFQLNLSDALTAFYDSCEHEKAPQDAADTARQFRLQLEMMRHALGMDILNDLLAPIGDTWRVFVQPGPQPFIDGWTLSVDLVDSPKLKKLHDERIAMLRNGSPIEIVVEEHVETTIYSVPIEGLAIVPCWCIHDDRLTLCSSVASVKRMISGDAPERTLAETDHVQPFIADGKRTFKLVKIDLAAVMKQVIPMVAQQLDSLPAGAPIDASVLPPLDVVTKFLQPTVIAVERTAAGIEITHHGTWPSIELGQAVPLLAAASLPAVDGARSAARLNQSINNQKQIALAMLNFESANGVFPAGYSANEEGKPLLSWRVHILPYLEAQALYEQFHLDEAWDSPHNKKLIERMPDIYRSPRSRAELGKTTYLGVGGADGIFVRPEDGNHCGIGLAQVTDGTSNTVMTVESADERAIVWTRPGDFAPEKEDPRKGLRVDPRQGMSLGFTDGSVQRLPKNVARQTLMSFFTKSGGEVVERP